MNTLTIILAQTRTGSIIEMVILLVVAALIGYLTAYFYHKAIYTQKLNKIQDDNDKLKNQLSSLQQQVNKLEKELKEKLE
ncbi:MAG: hypothetical protein CVU09_12225 [Bacteroidetes bacterium HGW-Bacteroidetes-4]|jgi:uncharacterized membrane-anchored protein YhcB (DUF1043 family)|nr:MAG: hypothetical protein CVU09_12225 [Bacteroidetes bacterium HGW-Bacteroidetes-4]